MIKKILLYITALPDLILSDFFSEPDGFAAAEAEEIALTMDNQEEMQKNLYLYQVSMSFHTSNRTFCVDFPCICRQ